MNINNQTNPLNPDPSSNNTINELLKNNPELIAELAELNSEPSEIEEIEDIEESEDIDEDDENLSKKKKARLNISKKRRQVDSRSVSSMYDNDDDPLSFLKKSHESLKTKQDTQLKEKIKQGFNKELSTFLAESKNPKAASLLQKNLRPSASDIISISQNNTDQNSPTKESQSQQAKKNQNLKKQAQFLKQPELYTPLKDYVALFGESQINQAPEKKEKLKSIRQSLQAKGIGNAQLLGIEQGVQTLINNDLKKMLKNKFQELILSFENKPTAEVIANHEKFKNVLATAGQFNLFQNNQKLLKDIKKDSKEELTHFLHNELDRTITETKLTTTSNHELIEAFSKFNELSKMIKFDQGNYLRYFNKKLENEGLTPFISPDPQGTLDTDFNQSNQQNSRQNHPNFEQTNDELEKELLTIEIKSYFSQGIISSVKTNLKKIALTSRCKRQNIDIITIKKQAKTLAILHAKMECRSLFEFRATLPTYHSPLYKQFQKKLKVILKILKKLNQPLNSSDLRLIRDQSNKAMFSIIKEEYIKTTVFLESNPNHPALLNKRKEFAGILQRLKSETAISENLSTKMLEDLQFLEDVNINEAA